MEYIEVSAKTVDEAITKACLDLEASSDRLDIQVISQGSSGFLGIGSKPAVIKVKKIEEEPAPAEPVKEKEKETRPRRENKENREHKSNKKNSRNRPKNSQKERPEEERSKKEEVKKKEKPPVILSEEGVLKAKQDAKEFLKGIFDAMETPVEIEASYNGEEGYLEVEFSGDDLGFLIGKRGQTLDSLQYLISLVVNKHREEYIRVKLDTENYRKRRKETLENLAKNIASKVKKTEKPVVLEPMNPYERRIIHTALQQVKGIETYSEGNEPYRHVVVVAKK